MVNQSEFCVLLKQYRKSIGFTQADLAKKIGCSTITYQRIETGKQDVTLSQILLLSEALSITAEKLLNVKATLDIDKLAIALKEAEGIVNSTPNIEANYNFKATTLITIYNLISNQAAE